MRSNCAFLHPTDPTWAQTQPTRRRNSDVVGQIPIPKPYPFLLTNMHVLMNISFCSPLLLFFFPLRYLIEL